MQLLIGNDVQTLASLCDIYQTKLNFRVLNHSSCRGNARFNHQLVSLCSTSSLLTAQKIGWQKCLATNKKSWLPKNLADKKNWQQKLIAKQHLAAEKALAAKRLGGLAKKLAGKTVWCPRLWTSVINRNYMTNKR